MPNTPVKSPSAARLAANRANAQKSTGPRSIQGKLRSRGNSATHNLTGRFLLLSPEDREIHDELAAGIIHDLRPATDLELLICRNIADAYWRLTRILSVEDALFALSPRQASPSADADPDLYPTEAPPTPRPVDVYLSAGRIFLHNSPAFTNLSLYEQRIHRTLKASMEELRRLQAERQAIEKRDMPRAVEHCKERHMHNLPFDPAADGFVFSTDEIEAALARQIRHCQVDAAINCKFNLAKFQKFYPPVAA